jgi:glycosyltransferase involved in cell wall biosynthesis
MAEITELLQPMYKLFNTDQNKVALTSASISEVIKGINQLNNLKTDDIEYINHSLDNSGAGINISNLRGDLDNIYKSHEALSEIFKIDSMPDWQELNSLKDFLYNVGFFERMGSAYKAAKSQLLSFKANPYIKLDQLLKALPDAVSFKKDSSLLNSNKDYVKSYGELMDGHKTRLDIIKLNVAWFESLKDNFEANSQTMQGFKNISNDLKNSLLSKSNIFVMPSIIHKKSVEGFGIAYVEAAQYNIPSIGGIDGGASDAIEHQKTGLICDGSELNDVYSSINSMLENKKYLEYGKAAKENSFKFRWNKIIGEYKKILN